MRPHVGRCARGQVLDIDFAARPIDGHDFARPPAPLARPLASASQQALLCGHWGEEGANRVLGAIRRVWWPEAHASSWPAARLIACRQPNPPSSVFARLARSPLLSSRLKPGRMGSAARQTERAHVCGAKILKNCVPLELVRTLVVAARPAPSSGQAEGTTRVSCATRSSLAPHSEAPGNRARHARAPAAAVAARFVC